MRCYKYDDDLHTIAQSERLESDEDIPNRYVYRTNGHFTAQVYGVRPWIGRMAIRLGRWLVYWGTTR